MNDDPNARPSLSERYGVAVSSGTSLDHMILAAGMQHERLGAVLLRLQSEYDAVKGDLERAGQIAPQRTAQARELAHRAKLAERLKDYGAAEVLKQRAAEIRERTPEEVLSARTFILMGLKTLHDAKQQFGAFALGMVASRNRPKLAGKVAERMGAAHQRNIKPHTASILAGQVLDVWLDPTCHTCDGTGHVGNAYAGETRKQCDTCGGSGHRRDIVGRNPKERIFARDLLAELQRRVAAAAGGMGQALAPPEATEPHATEVQHMQGRLAEMRADLAD